MTIAEIFHLDLYFIRNTCRKTLQKDPTLHDILTLQQTKTFRVNSCLKHSESTCHFGVFLDAEEVKIP